MASFENNIQSIMAGYDWKNYLMAGQYSIEIMGYLVSIASNTAIKDDIQHVVSSCCGAFREVDNRMNCIWTDANNIVAILQNVESHNQNQGFDQIVQLTDAIKAAAKSTVSAFNTVMKNILMTGSSRNVMTATEAYKEGGMTNQWTQISYYFEMMNNITNISLAPSLRKSESEVADLVRMLSSTYSEVSNRFFMKEIECLEKLNMLNADTPVFKTELAKLYRGYDEAKNGMQRCFSSK